MWRISSDRTNRWLASKEEIIAIPNPPQLANYPNHSILNWPKFSSTPKPKQLQPSTLNIHSNPPNNSKNPPK